MRWHQPYCKAPNVVLRGSDKLPYCEACEATCPTTKSLASIEKTGIQSLNIPPDEVFGRMNLFWPLSVPYKRVEPADCGDEESRKDELLNKLRISDKLRTSQPSVRWESTSKPQRTSTWPSRRSSTGRQRNSIQITQLPTYGLSLTHEEIRLACLPAASDPDEPLHLDLERFTQDNRPEYEAVSYTWGGEDDDSTPTTPVYIGPYWDVFLQTKNCCSMLQFMRPWRGIRTIWVDALCINQQDPEEREIQVSKMRQIYEQSSRVVVYLGPDLIVMNNGFPILKRLDELPDIEPDKLMFPRGHPHHDRSFTLAHLLRRRYFSRASDVEKLRRHITSTSDWLEGSATLDFCSRLSQIWVIQELLQAERVLFRVGNVNFHTDREVMTSMIRYRQSEWSGAPWLQHLAMKGFVPSSVIDVLSLMLLTSQSSASDPRDRLYGVISLLQDSVQRQQFPPDYSISCQHFFIGFFAHWILENKSRGTHHVQILRNAGLALRYNIVSEFKPPPCLPSWVPDCRSEQGWRENFTFLTSSTLYFSPLDAIHKAICGLHLANPTKAGTLSTTLSDISMRQIQVKELFQKDKRRWDSEAYIEAETGALSINLVHLFALPGIPSYITTVGESQIFEVGHQQDKQEQHFSKLYLAAEQDLPLVLDGDEHLFLLDRQSDPMFGHELDRHLFLILRPDTSLQPRHNQKHYYRLITSCSNLLREKIEIVDVQRSEEGAAEVISNIGHVSLSDLRISVADHIKFIYDRVSDLRKVDKGLVNPGNDDSVTTAQRAVIDKHVRGVALLVRWQQLFPNAQSADDIFVILFILYKSLHTNRQIDLGNIQAAYLSCLDKKYEPKVEHDYVELRFTADDWEQHIHNTYILPDLGPYMSPYNTLREKLRHRPAQYPWESIKASMLDTYCHFDWEWRHVSEMTTSKLAWQSCLHPFLYQIKKGAVDPTMRAFSAAAEEGIRVRAPISQVVDFLIRETEAARESMAKIVAAYDPPLTCESLEEIVRNGPTEEQKYIGVPKMFGGVVVDGSTYRVNII